MATPSLTDANGATPLAIIRCPDQPRREGDLTGCGASNIIGPDHEGVYDCPECGLFFTLEGLSDPPPNQEGNAAPTATVERQVSILLHEHKHGRDISAFGSYREAEEALFAIVAEKAQEIPSGLSCGEAIDVYFDGNQEESYDIRLCEVEFHEPANTSAKPKVLILAEGGKAAFGRRGEGPWQRQGKTPAARLAVGTKILSVFGEMSDTADAGDVATGPNAVGVVSGVHPGQEHCYSVAFPKGVSVFLSDAELADTACYRVEPAEADFPDRPARWRSGALAMLLRHPDSGVRLIATEAFGEIHGPAPEQALVKALQDEDGEVRWTAADGLRSIGTLSALAALAAVAEGDPMPTVREVAALAMDGIDPGRRRTGMKSDLFGEVGCPRFARKMTQKKCREYLVTAGKRETVDRLERESAPLGEWREQVELAEDGEFLGMVAKAHLELLRRQNEKTMPSEPGQCHS